MMKKIVSASFYSILLVAFVFCILSCSQFKSETVITSPDKRIAVSVSLSKGGIPTFEIIFDGKKILNDSELGVIREDADFSKGLSLDLVSGVYAVREKYKMLQGKKENINYSADEQILFFSTPSGEKMNIIFRVSNDGVAYRYEFSDTSDDIKKITDETGTYNFLPGTKCYTSIMSEAKTGWEHVNPGYEEHYQQGVAIENLPFNTAGWVYPALFQTENYWFLITETAPDRNYCGTRLQQDTTTHQIFIDFPQKPEVLPGGALNPESTLPWKSPWRIITVGDNLGTIVESTLGTDLAEKNRLEDVSFVKPGRASWSWALLKDNSVVYDVQKKFIDYAAEMNWEYCLVDVNWDTNIGYDRIGQLAAYAAKKNVGLILWYNSAGSWNTTPYHPKNLLLTHEDRVKEFSRLQKMGIKGVKVDFWGGDGQSVMAYYQDMFEDAAQFGLLVNCHGATLPRGWHRTYPNLVTVEAVRGFEYITFTQEDTDLEPTHSCFQPFTRNAFDPMDFTPVCFSEIPGRKRISTNGFELALSVVFWSGVQHFAGIPEGMAKVPDYVQEFMRTVPVRWDDTKFIDGFPGKLVVLARRNGSVWYIAGINGENVEKALKFDLSFIEEIQSGILITDGADNRTFEKKEIALTADKSVEIDLKPNGGFVITFE